jgi:hypothetical protein
MTTIDYHKALAKLGVTHASKATAAALGLSVSQCIRIANGQCPVPEPVAKLLRLARKHGITAEELAST